MNPAVPVPALATVVRGIASGAASQPDLQAAFLAATVYCERAPQPGFRAFGAPGRGAVPVFTSPRQLALARGAVHWFALPGADLLRLRPVGYDILLDVGSASPLRLRSGPPGHPPASDPGVNPPADDAVNIVVDPAVGGMGGAVDRAAMVSGARRGDLPRTAPTAAVLLAPVAELAAELRYDQTHELAFAGCAEATGWEDWQRRSESRRLGGPARLPAVAGRVADRAARTVVTRRPRRRTAMSVAGLGPAELRLRCGVRGRPRRVGTVAPVRANRTSSVAAWRTNLHTPPRSVRPSRVSAGGDHNSFRHATVATSLPCDEQEVRGVVLRSGPPVSETSPWRRSHTR